MQKMLIFLFNSLKLYKSNLIFLNKGLFLKMNEDRMQYILK